MLTQIPDGQHAAQPGQQAVVVALRAVAGITVDGLWDGAPSTHGVSSAGLHMPGAASLAHTASRVARSSGLINPRSSDMPSSC